MRIALIWSATCLAALAASPLTAQPAPASIRGRVVADDNDRPLRRALVTLARGDRRVRPVLTDEEGRFEIQLPDPAAALVVGKAGYASTIVEPDRRTVSNRELEIRLPRGAAMSGRVTARSGAPVIAARVVARRVETATSTNAETFEADSDDLGEYRIGGLPAGQYAVSAETGTVRTSLTPGQPPDRETVQGFVSRNVSLFPGLIRAPTGTARSVEVRAGEEIGVDLQSDPVPGLGPPPVSATPDFLKAINQKRAIRGRVVTPEGQPIGRAIVLIRGNNTTRMVTADADGQFEVGSFPEGRYEIEVTRPGYLMPDLRAQSDSRIAHVLSLGDDTAAGPIELVLSRLGAISGTIVDGDGEPFQGVLVRALRLRQDGARLVATMAAWPRLTDDRGRYRVFGLPPGSYFIVASLDASETASGRSRAPGFAPVYYPGTPHAESAQSFQLDIAGNTSDADLTFAVSSTARVTGTALNAAGNPLIGQVSLGFSHRSSSVVVEPRIARVAADGSFELTDVPPGDYVLQALGGPGPGTPLEFGAEYISVAESDLPPVSIKTSAGVTLEGRFIVEGMSDAPMRESLLRAAPTDPDRSPPPSGPVVFSDGRFYLTGLFGPMRLTVPSPLPGWYLKSMTIGGVDVTDVPFDFGFGDAIVPDAEIVLSSAGASIVGSIVDGTGARANAFSVVAFSTNRANWFAGSRHLKRASSGLNGRFDVNGLPPGEYFVAALGAGGAADWQAPETLQSLIPRAARVTVREGQSQTMATGLRR